MFQALKLEAEELRRQEQSAYIAEVGRRAAAEANLDRRVNILKEAVERYPEEPHLQQSYRLTRDRRDLVNSIVGKARQYEERGQFSEALGQWDILRNIYEQYPGREFEVQRLARRREDQVRDEAKARWTEQVDRHLDAGEYACALEVAQNALTEFVGDRELAGLERLAQQCLERSEEAQKWLDEGQALCLDHRLGDGLESLRKAAALDAKNVAIRAALLNALVEQARSLLGQDWQLAEPLVDQAWALDPGHPLAKNLRAVIGDYQRQQITDNCVSQARELQTDGNPAAALAKVEEVLAVYPNDVRLMQIRSRLRNQVDTKKQDSPPARSTPSTVHPPASAGLSVSQATMNDFEPTDIEKTRLQPAPDTKKTLAVTAVPQQSRTEPNWSPRKVWRQVATAARGFRADRLRRIPSRYVAAALLPILLLTVVLLTRTREARQAPPEGRAYAIEFECNTDGAKVLVDGQAVSSGPVKLSPGVHEVVANKVGYQPLRKSFTLVPDRPAPTRISLELQPALANLCLFGDFNSGQISLDNQPIEQMQDGSFVKENVPLGEHTLKVFDAGQEQMSFAFRTDPGALAILTSPLNARGYEALVVSSLGEQARVYGSAPIKGGMPGEALRPLPAEGLPLTGLSLARNELAVDNGKGSRPISIDVGSVPAISIWVTSPSMGAVAVRANTPDAQIIVDGRTLRTPLRNSKAVISLKPGLYHIRVAKEGYPRVPEQNVEVKKGETRQIAFELKPGANTASLLIEGATPAAEVWIDGKQSGETGRDGAFSRQDLPPGAHTITLRKTDFEEHAFRREIAVGQTTHLSGPETQLKPFGALALKVTPTNASLSYRREGDEQVREAVNGQVLRVQAGRYVINAKADRRTPHSETITVVPGRVTNVSWSLTTTVESRPAQNHLLQTKDYFENSNQWKSDGAWGEHDTPSTSWLERNQGLYTITVLRQSSNVLFLKRTKRVEWDADYRDENNRIQYWLDGHSLRRRHIVSGSVVSEIKQPVPDGSSYTFQIELRPDRVTV
ncbi:MAG TPA: PEGA domain-containing protein, partial [Bryobacteraceae bacterium]|nr:PEGA domain-containing protein [Bryobacteraceae bacterium]